MKARQAQAGQGYDAASFQVDPEHKTVTCPQGKTSRKWKRVQDHHHLEIIHVEFGKADCLACPVRALCTTAATHPRQLALRPQAQYEPLPAARKRQTIQEFKEEYALRTGVEGTLSQGLRAFGLRQARYIGQTKPIPTEYPAGINSTSNRHC